MILLCFFMIFIRIQSVPVEHNNDENLDDDTIFRDSEQFKTDPEITHHRVPRGVIWDESRRWPSSTIPYEFSSNMDKSLQNSIKLTMDGLERRTCLKFQQRTKTYMPKDYIFFKGDEGGCYSAGIGRVGGRQIINLGPGNVCRGPAGRTHEILHALGFIHEHQRMDRDKYIKINVKNMRTGYESDFVRVESDTMGLPYDLYSVMHYNSYRASKNNKPVIVPKAPGVGLLQQDKSANEMDILKINLLFRCNMKKHST